MKALGRTLWKVADSLLQLKRKKKSAGAKLVFGDDKEKKKATDKVMYDRLELAEERFATHLSKGGHEGSFDKPKPKYPRKPKQDDKKKEGKETKNEGASLSAEAEATFNSNGELETHMTTADVCKTLGLEGDGVGKTVALWMCCSAPVSLYLQTESKLSL